jgi:cytochrome c oxidase assembly protein subunit 15
MNARPVVIWLVGVCLMIVLMVAVGGITRLTGSGLSMVDWKPIMGAFPPRSEAAWQDTFSRYQASPQYQQVNEGMSLDAFKRIFFWEYVHRLLGRLIGVVFLVPYLYFLARRQVRGPLAAKLGLAFVLGGAQGLLGWYMVKSGLVDKPHVSHFRLAAHLSLALALLAYLWWLILDLLPRRSIPGRSVGRALRVMAVGFALLLCLQIIYGAFVAGLKAGYFFNTFPTMQGFWFPPGMYDADPASNDFFNNPIMVQFVHRCLGWILGCLAVGTWLVGRRSLLESRATAGLNTLLFLTLTQFTLGALTLVFMVPVALATLHQVVAALLLLAAIALLHDLYTQPTGSIEVAPARATENMA